MVVEAAAIIGIAAWVAAPVLNRLIGKVKSYVVHKYKLHKGLAEKLERLGRLLDEIGSTVSLVEARRINNHSVVCWLAQLKGAIDEVIDIFDILDCDIVKSSQLVDPAAEPSPGCIGSAESLERLKKLVGKLDDIRKSSRGLVQASMLAVTTMAGRSSDGSSSSSTWSRPVTGPSLPFEPLGYSQEYKKLRSWLVPPADDREKPEDDGRAVVVAIIGHGGMGKTTLARRAWNDPVVQKSFGLFIWASVYNKFGEAELLGEIWRSAPKETDAEAEAAALARHGGDTDMSFGSIQLALEKLVAASKSNNRPYLLVLDDVCNDETATDLQRREVWSHVLAPFQRGERGSRVLVTTRALICAQTLGARSSRRITLDGVDSESFVNIVKTNAALFGCNEEVVIPDELLRISSKDPEHQWNKGSPLAAKEIALKLRNTRNKNRWPEILTTTTDCHENVILTHVSSYQQLPPHLQHCLAFASLFPNNFRFQTEMLVKMWVAHGFVNEDGSATVEDTARGYFNELLFRSFVQPLEEDKTDYYVIHEQIHSMIRWVSANYFLMLRGKWNSAANKKIPLTVRHLSVTASYLSQLKKMKNSASVLKKLRTFLVFRDSSSPEPIDYDVTDSSRKSNDDDPIIVIDKDLLRELSGVRVMDLTGADIEKLPQDIGSLIHLRYLALPNTVQELPDEFGKLYHLQTLIGSSNDSQTADPMKAFNFRASTKTGLEQLARMDSLRGSLAITRLDVVANMEDALKCLLKNKVSLAELKFEWDATVAVSASDLQVLEGLKPHTGLQALQIRRYRGTSSPSWFTNNCLNQLRALDIINCRNLKVLPPFGHLPHLMHLHIQEVTSVEKIDGDGPFKSLETLVLYDLQSLVEWTAGATRSGSTTTTLTKIEIVDCPRFNKPPPFQSDGINLKYCPQLKKCGAVIVPTQATTS